MSRKKQMSNNKKMKDVQKSVNEYDKEYGNDYRS